MIRADLQPYDIQSYYVRKLSQGRVDGKGGLSARSVVYHHRILSKALDYTVKMGVAVRNVARLVEPPRVARVMMHTLSPEESSRFLDAARETEWHKQCRAGIEPEQRFRTASQHHPAMLKASSKVLPVAHVGPSPSNVRLSFGRISPKLVPKANAWII